MNYSQSVELKVISDFNEFQKLQYTWNELLTQSRNDRVFMTHEWFNSWWQAFGEGKSLFIILLKNDDEIIGIIPLMRCQSTFRGLPVRSIKCIENDDSPGCGFIVKKGYEQVVTVFISFLLRDVRNWDILFFKNIPYDEGEYRVITNSLDQFEKRYIIKNGLRSPFIKIGDDWNAYLERISTKSKKTIRNVCNRIKRLGNIEVKEFNNTENFDDITSITKKGWKFKEGISFINRNDREKFFSILSVIAQKKEWLSLWCLYKDKQPVAYEYHLKYNRIVTALISEYNSDYTSYSPGAYLDFEIVKSLFNKQIYEYDMCGAQDEYKKKWTKDIRQYRNLIVFNDSIYSKLLYFIETRLIVKIKRARDKILEITKGSNPSK